MKIKLEIDQEQTTFFLHAIQTYIKNLDMNMDATKDFILYKKINLERRRYEELYKNIFNEYQETIK